MIKHLKEIYYIKKYYNEETRVISRENSHIFIILIVGWISSIVIVVIELIYKKKFNFTKEKNFALKK